MINKTVKLGFQIPTILLPDKDINLSKWSVVACDQYTSQPEYWAEVKNIVGETPSTLKLTLPEIYLEEGNKEERIENINNNMKKYIDEGILVSQYPGFIFIDRKTSHAESRKGLIIAVDLEAYDFNKGSQSLIRATEGTVIDRLPPRVKIRQNAPLELPHVMLLIDDPEKTVIEPLSEKLHLLEKIYDFDLMMDGGHIKGYKLENKELIYEIENALEKLANADNFKSKYCVGPEKSILLFAVGDGNHSLASAKVHWENVKKTLSRKQMDLHPARYALVEVVNVHDDGLEFEPIHRVVFNINVKKLLDEIVTFCGTEAYHKEFESFEIMDKEIENIRNKKDSHVIPYIAKDTLGIIVVESPKFNLEVGTLQCYLDELVQNDKNVKIDYIHGEEVVKLLGSKEGNIGFFLPPMDKQDLFKTVILDGTLPRKTFSMGEAEEKRFYLECRKIK